MKQVCERHALAKIRTCGCFTSPLRYNLTAARTARGAQKNGAESSVWQERGDDHKGTPPISVVLPSRRERPPNKAGSTVPTRVQNILGRPESGQGKPLHPRTCPPTGPTAVRSKPRNISTSTHPPSGSRIYPMRLRISPWLWFSRIVQVGDLVTKSATADLRDGRQLGFATASTGSQELGIP